MAEKYNLRWNDYYVGITRSKSNLYLISNHDIPFLKAVDRNHIKIEDKKSAVTEKDQDISFLLEGLELPDDLPF